MGAYVQTYGEKASIVVATERYTQRVSRSGRATPRIASPSRTSPSSRPRASADGSGSATSSRPTARASRDREDRLIQILTDGVGQHGRSAAAVRRKRALQHRSDPAQLQRARRPALFFFRPENLDRFKFTRKGVRARRHLGDRVSRDGTADAGPDARGRVGAGGRQHLGRTPTDGTVVRTRIHMNEFAVAAVARAERHRLGAGRCRPTRASPRSTCGCPRR